MQETSCRAILFDLDGVLVDSTVIVERLWRLWAEHHGLEAEFILANTHGRRTIDTLRTVASHLNLDLEQEAALLEKRESEETEGLLTVPGAVELVRVLPGQSWAVVTSGSRLIATTRLQAVGLPIPHTLVTAEEVCQGKPHPEGYLQAVGIEVTRVSGDRRCTRWYPSCTRCWMPCHRCNDHFFCRRFRGGRFCRAGSFQLTPGFPREWHILCLTTDAPHFLKCCFPVEDTIRYFFSAPVTAVVTPSRI